MTDDRADLPTASPFASYEKCAGKFQLELEAKRIGQSAHVESEDASRGDRIHAWLAGQKLELVETEATTAGFLQERAAWQVERIFEGKEYQTFRERRLWMHLDGRPVLSGQFDVCYHNNETALIQDYKTGFTPPEGEEQNAQMRVLAVLCGLNLPSVKEIIIQLITGPFGIFERRFTIKDLEDAYRDILETLKAINAADPPLTPGVEQCKHCAASNICPAIRKLADPVSKFSLTKLPEDPERSGELLDKIEVLENAFQEIKAFYYNRLLNDSAAEITGYALVPNAPRREIADVQAAKQRLAEFLDDGELNTAMDLKVGQVEKLFGKKVGLKGKELREKFNTVMNGVLTEKEPKPSLKRVSGKPKLKEMTLA